MNAQHLRTLADADLLDCIVAQQPEALSELYDRFSKLLYGIILAVARDTDDAEDILQDVFVQVWKNASSYKAPLGSPKTWLSRLAHNRAIDLLRSKRYQQKKSEVHPADGIDSQLGAAVAIGENSTWKQTLNNDYAGHVATALQQLPQEQSQLIELAFFQGYTHQEIATQTGIPLGTVKTRIRSGMQTLRAHLGFVGEESN